MLVNLEQRSTEEELMDDPDIDAETLKIALSDISRVNQLLGGNKITIHAIFNVIKKTKTDKEFVILDIGCGDGEILRHSAVFFRKKGINVKLIGIDLNPKSIDQAKSCSTLYPEISFYQRDILELDPEKFMCDIVICTLTLHHFREAEIKKVIQQSMQISSSAVIINDLHRSKLAFYLFKIFSLFFIKGYVAKHDGLISIKRGFKKQELSNYAKELILRNYTIKWKWAFRYCWTIHM